MKRTVAILLAAAWLLAGCNTIEGLGKAIRTGGEKIEEAAKKK